MEEVRFKHCWVAQREGSDKRVTYSTFGLSHEGRVYRWDGGCHGWLPQNMEIASCLDAHKETKPIKKNKISTSLPKKQLKFVDA